MAGSTSGISPGFPGLSRSSGHVTHVLLTRSRLCPRPKPGSSLHLHVLSTPPAFVLSQDQTLRERLAWYQSARPEGQAAPLSIRRASSRWRPPRTPAAVSISTGLAMPCPRARVEPERDHRSQATAIARAVEFSKTACALR